MTRRVKLAVLVGMAGLLLPVAGHACPITDISEKSLIPSENYDISVTTLPPKIAVGDLFAVQLDVCRKDGSGFDGDISARAIMPAHKHGMNYEPEVVSAKDGRYILEGFAFHMQGQWQFQFDLSEKGETTTVLLDYLLK